VVSAVKTVLFEQCINYSVQMPAMSKDLNDDDDVNCVSGGGSSGTIKQELSYY